MGKSGKLRVSNHVTFIVISIAILLLGVQHLIVQRYNTYMLRNNLNRMDKPSTTTLPFDTLRLNTNTELECPRILILRTPKTASSSLADILHQRLNSGGRSCERTYLAAHQFLAPGRHTLTEEVLAQIAPEELARYSAFCAHMNYSPQLRSMLEVNELYRVATIRDGEARAISLVAYEEKRIGRVPMRPMLEYLGAPRLHPAVANTARLETNLTGTSIGKQINAAIKHFNLIVVSEMWEQSLAVLMYDLNLRLVDLLLPRVNVQSNDAKLAAFKRVQAQWTPKRQKYYKWMVNVDSNLHKQAVLALRARFASLPLEFQKVTEALKILQPMLTKECPTDAREKHFKMREIKCFRRFRQRMLTEAGVDGAVGEMY